MKHFLDSGSTLYLTPYTHVIHLAGLAEMYFITSKWIQVHYKIEPDCQKGK